MTKYRSIQHSTNNKLTTIYAQATEVQGFSADDTLQLQNSNRFCHIKVHGEFE